MESTPFFIAQQRPIRPGMTVSRPLHLGQSTGAAWFSLGGGTSISPERYDRPALYLGAEGEGTLLLGAEHRRVPLGPDTFVFVPACTLCGAETESGIVYTEIEPRRWIYPDNENGHNRVFAPLQATGSWSTKPSKTPGRRDGESYLELFNQGKLGTQK